MMTTSRISPRDVEALSAYLDDGLNPRQRSRLEKRLETSSELRAALEELRSARAMLRSLPRLRAPRSFTLTPQMAGRRRWLPRLNLYPAMSMTAALAALWFVIILTGDIIISTNALPNLARALGAPEAGDDMQVESASLPQVDPTEEAEAAADGGATIMPYPVENLTEAPPVAPTQTPTGTPTSQGSPTRSGGAPPVTPKPDNTATQQPEATPSARVIYGHLGETQTAQPSSTPRPTSETLTIGVAHQPDQGTKSGLSTVRIVEIILAVLAITMGAATLLLRRRSRII